LEILLVNDDGIYAPGLQAMAAELATWGHVTIAAPAVEQSGVGHSITYLHPIVAHKEYRNGEFYGWRVEGSPADCVKLGVMEFCPRKPDLIVSGINHGANVGINILYSGTVAAAIEGAFFGITSMAMSQWIKTPPDFAATAKRALVLAKQLWELSPTPGMLWNLNFPPPLPDSPKGVKFVSMGARRQREKIEKRTDPRGRDYFWAGLDPLSSHHMDDGTDVPNMLDGYITVTPLQFDLTEFGLLERLRGQELRFE
jgi:5'-nucleotidase